MESATLPPVEAPIEMLPVASLRLDALNPRRTDREIHKTQKSLLIELYERFDLDDILASLSAYGYFSEEPLIAIADTEPSDTTDAPTNAESSDTTDAPTYTVVEGNRRLAALKILLFKEYRNAVKLKQPVSVEPSVWSRLDPVPVKVYDSREEVHPYLGVRHIVGVKAWGSLAKAKYIRSLFEQGYTLQDVARRVGSGKRTDVVRRWLLTLYTIEQANQQSDEPWDEVEKGFGFSWLYTSLGYQSVREYLGVTHGVFSSPNKAPVPKQFVEHLLLHMTDLYGSPPGRPREAVVRESRQIRDLARIYDSKDALAALRSGVSFELCVQKTVNEKTQLVELLRNADYDLAQANGIAPHHAGHLEAEQIARRCLKAAETLVSTLQTT